MHFSTILIQHLVAVNIFFTIIMYHLFMSFNERLKEEMEYKNLQHKELAAIAKIKPRTLLTYVGSHPSMPPADVAVRLADALDVSVKYLVDGEKENQKISAQQMHLLASFEKLSEKEKKAVVLLIQQLTN